MLHDDYAQQVNEKQIPTHTFSINAFASCQNPSVVIAD